MPTIAELQIKLDSRPVVEGTKALNDFSTAAERASKATESKKVSDDNLANSSKKVATETDTSSKAIDRQNKQFETLLGKIDPITKKLSDLAAQEKLLFANKDKLSVGAFDAYNAKLQESFDKLLNVNTAQKNVSQSAGEVPDRLNKVAQAALNSADAQEKLTTAFRGASEAEQGLVSSGAVDAANRRAAAALEEFNAKRQLKGATDAAAAAEKGQAESLNVLLNRIDPTIKKLQELESLQRDLNKQKLSGNINAAEFERYNRILESNKETLTRYSQALNTTGKTAKETAFALRGLPAQFTDIVVSLQGGQAPLTVLLQQGGQIKDMFGGVVPALKAVGGAALAMITPVSLAATGLAVLGIAAYQGSEELNAFNKAIILSNNAAGVSASQFAQYRNELDGTVTTAGKAAEALTLIASGGRVAGESFQKVAESAILFQKATGQALSETIADFNAIGKDPVDAAVRLDEKYKFLTASVLAQAQALITLGNDSEAATLLQDKLAEATTDAAKKVIEQAGYMEQAWNGVKSAILGTFDALKGLGRDTTTTDRLAELQRQRKSYQDSIDTNASLGLKGFGQSGNIQAVADIDKEIAQVKQRIQYEALLAKQEADTEKARREAVSAQVSSARRYENAQKGVEAAESNLRKIRLENQKITAGGNVTAEQTIMMTRNEARAVEELAKAKEKDSKSKRTPLDTREVTEVKNNLDQLTAEYDGYYKRVTAIGQAGIVSAEATFNSQKSILAAQRAAVSASYDAQIESLKALRDNKKNTAAQNISLDNQMAKAESDRIVALEKIDTKQDQLLAKEQGRLETRTRNIAAYKASLDAQLNNLQEEGARRADGVGRGDRQAGVARQLASNDRSFERQQRELTKSLSEGMDPEEYTAKLKDLEKAHTEMTAQIVKNDEEIQAANADWTNGFTAAVENAQDAGMNFAGSVQQALTGAFDTAADSLANFVLTGKFNFKDFTVSILSDLAKIAAKQATLGALGSLFNIVGGAAGSYFGGAGTTTATSGFSDYGQITTVQEKGGGWSGGTQFFAQGGAFTNSIVSSPTSFGMSGGQRGVMGEAGPEAIVPLARTADGSLGVRMIGGGEVGGRGVNVYISITSEGTTTETDEPQATQFGKDIGDYVDSRYQTLLTRDLKPGGQISRAIGG
jgi:lambda family phage tail tape measure protein